jgi:hypothetical protein
MVGSRIYGSPRQPPQYTPPEPPPAEQVWGTVYPIAQTIIVDTATWQEAGRWSLATLVPADDTIRAVGFELRIDDALTGAVGEITGAGTVYRNDTTGDVLTNTDDETTSAVDVVWTKNIIEAGTTIDVKLLFDGTDVVLQLLGVITGTRVAKGYLWLSLPITYIPPT